jgi:hypothetical protein
MKILVLDVTTKLGKAALSRIERRLRECLRPLTSRLAGTTARIGGTDDAEAVACTIEARLQQGGRLLIYERGRDPLDASRRAAASLKAAVAEHGAHARALPPAPSAGAFPETAQ